MKTITYIDLGLHKRAEEITMMLKACVGLPVKLKIYGIEANPNYISNLREQFAEFENVQILCYAITDKATAVDLYLSPDSHGHGNSIYRGKNNVTDKSVPAVGMPLTTLIDNKTLELSEFNILKFNIEGAEYLLMKDLLSNQMQHAFNIFCGAPTDMYKVKELAHLQSSYLAALDANGIKVEPFYHWPQPEKVEEMTTNMRKRILEIL